MIRKNILLVIPEMTTGGAQRSLANLSLELSGHFNVWLVVFNRERNVAYKHGGTLLSLDVIPGSSWISKFLALLKRVKRLKKIKRELKIDVAISFLEGADYINLLSSTGEKIILSIRGSKVHDEIMRSYAFWLRSKVLIPWLYKKANKIVSVNNGIANELILYYKLPVNKIQSIGNFYDSQLIVSTSEEPKSKCIAQLYKFPVLVCTGRLNREKGLEYIVRIFSKLKILGAQAKLVLVGDGPEKERLTILAKELNLRLAVGEEWNEMPDIVITGNQENVFKFLNGAALYLMNSSSEGFPNGIVEAMICKVPVISSNCPYGPSEILAPGDKLEPNQYHDGSHGILMPVAKSEGDIKFWTGVIAQLLNDDDRRERIAEQAFARAKNFTRENVINQWLQVINE